VTSKSNRVFPFLFYYPVQRDEVQKKWKPRIPAGERNACPGSFRAVGEGGRPWDGDGREGRIAQGG